jgi:hypothetical protein
MKFLLSILKSEFIFLGSLLFENALSFQSNAQKFNRLIKLNRIFAFSKRQ